METNDIIDNTVATEEVAQPQPKVDEVKATETQVIDERNKVEDPYTDLKEFDPDKDETPSTYFPTDDYQSIYDAISKMAAVSKEVLQQAATAKLQISAHVNKNGGKNGLIEKTYLDPLSDPDSEYLNKLCYGEKTLVPGPVKMKAKTGVLSGQSALAAFSTNLGIGEIVEVPLWHSGFWVALRPPKQSEIVALQSNIADAVVKFGRDTNGAIYSNYGVIATRIVLDFVKDHILHTSLDAPVEELYKHVCVQDIQALVLGVVISMFPKGAPVTRGCINTTRLDESGLPKCDYSVTGQVDPKKLLFVNRKALTKDHLQIMSKKMPNSVKVDEAAEYRKTLPKLADRVIEFTTDDKVIKFKLSLPDADTYMVDGEEWANNIIGKAESLFTDADNTTSKENRVTDMLYTYILGIYSTFITEISMDDIVVNDKQTIIALLETLSTNESILRDYIKKMVKYISETAVAIIATPSYVCPKCKSEQETSPIPEFHNLIPLNVLETFFDLCALRELRVRLATM